MVNVIDTTHQAKAQMKIILDELHLTKLASGHKKVKRLKEEIISIIKKKIGERFGDVSEYVALTGYHLTPHYGILAKTKVWMTWKSL